MTKTLLFGRDCHLRSLGFWFEFVFEFVFGLSLRLSLRKRSKDKSKSTFYLDLLLFKCQLNIKLTCLKQLSFVVNSLKTILVNCIQKHVTSQVHFSITSACMNKILAE